MLTMADIQKAAELLAARRTPGWAWFSEETRETVTNGWVNELRLVFAEKIIDDT